MHLNFKGPVGIIPDMQFPGHIDNALEFILDTGSDYGVQDWICVGDLIDHHYISRHPVETDAWNPRQEVALVRQELKAWVKAFPNLWLAKGNHDLIPNFRAASLGMPDLYLKSLNEIYGLPNTWVWDDQFTFFNRTLLDHGMGSGGMYGAKNTGNKLACSYIQGHTHGYGGVFDLPSPFGDRAAMNVGCLMDAEKYNARYAKYYFKVPVSLGMGIAFADDEMFFKKYK